jgi:hypothetical protein
MGKILFSWALIQTPRKPKLLERGLGRTLSIWRFPSEKLRGRPVNLEFYTYKEISQNQRQSEDIFKHIAEKPILQPRLKQDLKHKENNLHRSLSTQMKKSHWGWQLHCFPYYSRGLHSNFSLKDKPHAQQYSCT